MSGKLKKYSGYSDLCNIIELSVSTKVIKIMISKKNLSIDSHVSLGTKIINLIIGQNLFKGS